MAVYLQTHVGQEQIGVIASDLTEAKNIWHGEIHSHAAYELQILLGGSCQVEVDGTKYTVPVHHALITAPNIHHKTLSVDGTYERYGMLFAVEEGPLQQALQEEVPVCKVYPVTEETEALCRYIFLEWDRRPADVRSFLQSQMALLLQNNFRLLGVSCYKQSDSVWPSGRLYTYLIDTFFSSHLTEGSCLDALAEDLHLSRSQVNRVIKSITASPSGKSWFRFA